MTNSAIDRKVKTAIEILERIARESSGVIHELARDAAGTLRPIIRYTVSGEMSGIGRNPCRASFARSPRMESRRTSAVQRFAIRRQTSRSD